jgi:uncharacterized protein
MSSPEKKFRQLQDLLQQYDTIAVAFSGGVDSTLMLHAAVSTLGPERVIALYALSTLNSADAIAATRATFSKNFPKGTVLREIEVLPLLWQEFVMNTGERCYFCKKRMYAAMQISMAAEGFLILADGTNVDDVREGRPGLKAIRERQVRTPLVEAGLTKQEIRKVAKDVGLTNFDLPSNSCLATRIQQDTFITENALRTIETAEQFLHERGFQGCRVRVGDSAFFVEVQEKDFTAFIEEDNRTAVRAYFQALHIGPIMLNLAGR